MSKKSGKGKSTGGVKRTPSSLRNLERESLSAKERLEIGLKAAGLRLQADAREDRLRDESSKERKDIKGLRARAREHEQMFKDGYRIVPAGNMFSDEAKKKRGEDVEEESTEKSSKTGPVGVAAASSEQTH